MRALQVAERAVSIWFSREDAPTRGQMLCLVRRALADRGYRPWPETEAECFAAGEDTLLIARPGRARTAAFYFESLDRLLAAAACGRDGGALYAAGRGGYLLTAPAADVCAALYEFGEPVRLTPEREAHETEQGRQIIPDAALAALREAFRPEFDAIIPRNGDCQNR